jgi:hypothetical protein
MNMHMKESSSEDVNWIELVQGRMQWWYFVFLLMFRASQKGGELFN